MANITKILRDTSALNRPAKHVPKKPQAPANRNVLAAAVNKDARIDVRIFKRKVRTEIGQGDFYAKFRLYSHVQPNFAVEGSLELDRKSESEMSFESGVLCGAMAERIDEVYGDNFDAEAVARTGSAQLARVIDAWSKETERKV